MRYPSPHLLCSLFLVLALQSIVAAAQEVPPALAGKVPIPDMEERLVDYEERLQNFFEGIEEMVAQELTETEQQQEKNISDAPEDVAERPTTATPPEGFSDRVLDNISDFLPYFQFAVNSVTANEDHTAVTLKFNPIDTELGALSLSATASEPKVYDPLADAIGESVREAQKEALLESVGDFDDITATLTYGFQKPGGRFNDTRKMFGRNVALYQSLITDLVDSTRNLQNRVAQAQVDLSPFIRKIGDSVPGTVNISQMTLREIRERLGESDFKLFLSHIEASNAAIAAVSLELQAADLDALAAFISNQPQATLSVTRQVREEVLGPEALSATLSYEMGTRNFNRVLREYRRLQRTRSESEPEITPLSAFSAVAANPRYRNEDKFAFSITYKDVDDYTFDHPYQEIAIDPNTGEERRFDRLASITTPGATEWRGTLLWTRLLTKLPFAARSLSEGDTPRFTLSVESVDISGDPIRQSHVLGKLSLVLPLSDTLTLPVTFTYSDRPELLMDQDELFGGHIGITYRLNRHQNNEEEN